MSLAEKVTTMMSRRELNTGDRDFADTWVFSRVHRFAARDLRSAIGDVATHRGHNIVTLAVALADMPDRQQTYARMLTRMAYQRMPPTAWSDLLEDIRSFIDPLIEDTTGQLTEWDPATQTWSRSRTPVSAFARGQVFTGDRALMLGGRRVQDDRDAGDPGSCHCREVRRASRAGAGRAV
jgi:hypothetical protein